MDGDTPSGSRSRGKKMMRTHKAVDMALAAPDPRSPTTRQHGSLNSLLGYKNVYFGRKGAKYPKC
ncbi:hypothetical protein E2562_001387 [Oryza meyeriana var. granulata]|uniref:Uncharacterized protein n=1 Tax=Oryza meyeriana var. granulata TaxID=110450 RepID=A0A6G1DDC1_9ORYZ|nr:hypothetical protein E2562_001387 [Oryza meyeriana var. granulata]